MKQNSSLGTGPADMAYKLIRWGLGAVFIYAGSVKLADPRTFAVLMEAYGILPESWLLPVAVALPALEVVAGVGLVFDIEGSLPAIAGLLLVFMAILGYGIAMGLDVDCGCFGPEDPEAEAFHGLRQALYRDLLMFGGIGYLFAWRRYRGLGCVRIRPFMEKLRKRRQTTDAMV